MKIRLAGITEESCVDGTGLRFVVFVQGCRSACAGCHNPDTWDENGGKWVEVAEIVDQIIGKADLLDGITLSGGEPFLQTDACLELINQIHAKNQRLSVVVYSGYTFEELINNEKHRKLLERSDVLVDGPYIQEKRSELPFRGSSNQRILDLRKSLPGNKAVLVFEP